jgi:hypothetical protein
MNARDRILNRVDEATRATKDAIAKAKAEARARGETFDLAKFHADREEAVSAERDTARFGKSFEGQGTRPGSRQIRRNKAQLKGRIARGRQTPEDIAAREKARQEDEESGLDPKTGQRREPMTGHQIGGAKRSGAVSTAKRIRSGIKQVSGDKPGSRSETVPATTTRDLPKTEDKKRQEARKKAQERIDKERAKREDSSHLTYADYTDEEIVNLIMTESYLSLFSSLK